MKEEKQTGIKHALRYNKSCSLECENLEMSFKSPLIYIRKLILLKLISETYNPGVDTRMKLLGLQRGMSFEITSFSSGIMTPLPLREFIDFLITQIFTSCRIEYFLYIVDIYDINMESKIRIMVPHC